MEEDFANPYSSPHSMERSSFATRQVRYQWYTAMILIGAVSTISTMLAVLLTIDVSEGNSHAQTIQAFLLLLFGYASTLMFPAMLIGRQRFLQFSAQLRWIIATGLPIGYASIIGLLFYLLDV